MITAVKRYQGRKYSITVVKWYQGRKCYIMNRNIISRWKITMVGWCYHRNILSYVTPHKTFHLQIILKQTAHHNCPARKTSDLAIEHYFKRGFCYETIVHFLFLAAPMFSPGQLVWAKMRSYPPWPARVSRLKSRQTFWHHLALWNSTLSFAVFLSPFRLIFLHQKKECMQINLLSSSSEHAKRKNT